jgi:FtsH-binding integral membrane protein
LGLGLLGYVGRLFSQQGMVVTKDATWNLGGMLFAGLVALYILLLIAQPQFAPRSKWMLAIGGIVVLIVSHIIYQDTPSAHIYLGDIMKLFGILLLVGGASGLFHDEKVIEARKMEEAEIIEV